MEARFVIFLLALPTFSGTQPIKLFNGDVLPFKVVSKPIFSLGNSLLSQGVRPVFETHVFKSPSQGTTVSSLEGFLFPDDPLLGGETTEVQIPVKEHTADEEHTTLQVHSASDTSSIEDTNSHRHEYESTSPNTITEPALSIAEEEVTTQKIIIVEPERSQVVNSDFQTTATSPSASENATPYTEHLKTDDSLAPRLDSNSAIFPAQDEITTKSSKPVPVPVDGGRRVFDVPNISCPEGTRRSDRGQCRKVYQ